MYDPVAMTGPLAGFAHGLPAREGPGAVALGPCPAQGKLLIRTFPADRNGRAALADALSTGLPDRHSQVLRTGRLLAMAPGDWLWHGRDAALHGVRDRVQAALAPFSAAFIDMSAGLTAVLVKGDRARDLLQAGCPVDLSDSLFRQGHVARSLFRRYPVTILRCEAADEYIVHVARSLARSLCASMIAQSAHWGISWLDDETPTKPDSPSRTL